MNKKRKWLFIGLIGVALLPHAALAKQEQDKGSAQSLLVKGKQMSGLYAVQLVISDPKRKADMKLPDRITPLYFAHENPQAQLYNGMLWQDHANKPSGFVNEAVDKKGRLIIVATQVGAGVQANDEGDILQIDFPPGTPNLNDCQIEEAVALDKNGAAISKARISIGKRNGKGNG